MTQQEKTRLFLLGRKVNFALPYATLKPKSADMKKAAKELEITQAEAWRAWNVFTWEAC